MGNKVPLNARFVHMELKILARASRSHYLSLKAFAEVQWGKKTYLLIQLYKYHGYIQLFVCIFIHFRHYK